VKLRDAGREGAAEPPVLTSVSHPWFDCAVNVSVPPPVFDTVTCPLAALLPCVREKLSMTGETERLGGVAAATTVNGHGYVDGGGSGHDRYIAVDVPGDRFATLTEN